ncbi:MAG TPA: GDSL-type esterase/lipase family protein [Tepidisphaeraceae bacterium]|nr:GDSL-type esterase/lipase family protein [Tepidisphaeraceae bacterium]
MRQHLFIAATGLLALVAATTRTTTNPSIRPASRGGWWMQRHQAICDRLKQGPVDLIFVGDSIIQNYDKHNPPDEDFQPTWNYFYGDRNAINMGFSGDHTGNVLWRLQHGEVDGITPKVAVLLIGTNNTAGAKQTAQQTIAGIQADVALLHEKLPSAKVLLLGILPSDITPEKGAADAAVNAALAQKYADSDYVRFLDIGPVFMRNGKLDASLFYDPRLPPGKDGKPRGPLHPDTHGQRMMAEAIEPTLAKLMGDRSKVQP